MDDICLETIGFLEDEGFDASEIDKDSWNLTKGNCCVQITRMFTTRELDAPCVVCQKKEEVDSGMCEDCYKEGLEHLDKRLNQDPKSEQDVPYIKCKTKSCNREVKKEGDYCGGCYGN